MLPVIGYDVGMRIKDFTTKYDYYNAESCISNKFIPNITDFSTPDDYWKATTYYNFIHKNSYQGLIHAGIDSDNFIQRLFLKQVNGCITLDEWKQELENDGLKYMMVPCKDVNNILLRHLKIAV